MKIFTNIGSNFFVSFVKAFCRIFELFPIFFLFLPELFQNSISSKTSLTDLVKKSDFQELFTFWAVPDVLKNILSFSNKIYKYWMTFHVLVKSIFFFSKFLTARLGKFLKKNIAMKKNLKSVIIRNCFPAPSKELIKSG